MKNFDFLVFIGRFQPFHLGHLRVVREALIRSEYLIICCGSAHRPRSLQNPWSFEERKAMILGALEPKDRERVIIVPVMDQLYNDDMWVASVQTAVSGTVSTRHRRIQRQPKIGLIGHEKDHTGYYLNLFPQWDSVAVANYQDIHGTLIREQYFNSRTPTDFPVPTSVIDTLALFSETDVYQALAEESEFIKKYRSAWDSAPYPPTFVTVDAVVVQSGHVLLVERKAQPGRGLWALPGGFVGGNERLLDACLRELKEETRIKLPVPVLAGALVRTEVFDHPDRSPRGRTITHAFHLALKPDNKLPKVRGADDAKTAFWLPLSELDPNRMFEDHFFIIQELAC